MTTLMPIITLPVFDRAVIQIIANKPCWRDDREVQAELKRLGFQKAHLNRVRAALARLCDLGLARATEDRTDYFLYTLTLRAKHVSGAKWRLEP